MSNEPVPIAPLMKDADPGSQEQGPSTGDALPLAVSGLEMHLGIEEVAKAQAEADAIPTEMVASSGNDGDDDGGVEVEPDQEQLGYEEQEEEEEEHVPTRMATMGVAPEQPVHAEQEQHYDDTWYTEEGLQEYQEEADSDYEPMPDDVEAAAEEVASEYAQ
jgi:hypothetical protein